MNEPIIYDFEVRKDVKGGSPKSPSRGIPLESQEQPQVSNGLPFWRTIAIILITADLTGFGGWIAFGLDSVKHSEIQNIMDTRAPYLHDKQRIDDRFSQLDRRIGELENQYHEILKKRLDQVP